MSGKSPKIISPGEVAFALGRSSLGEVLVARGANGICAILLGDEPKSLVRDLGALYTRDRLIGSEDASLLAAVQAAERAVEEPWRKFDLPLDIGGTEFQRRVWRELREIPAGTTTSYTEIARRIGAPKALRAVAGACAANVLAIAIPCHRVLRSNGSLSGYRWGMERKRKLIELEQSHRAEPRPEAGCDNLS
jgi:AraC family transcriptional regulator of adaptative response/methylated-DNA-[protein]-cysteine methyltransferase